MTTDTTPIATSWSSWRVRLAFASPLVATIALVTAALVAGAAPLVLILGGTLSVLAVGVALSGALQPANCRRWGAAAASIALAGVISGPLLRVVERPLTYGPMTVLVPLAAIAAVAVVLRLGTAGTRTATLSAVGLTIAGGVSIGFAYSSMWDALGLAMACVGVLGSGVALAAVLLTQVRGVELPVTVRAASVMGPLVAAGVLVREYARGVAYELDTPTPTHWLLAAAIALILLAGLAAVNAAAGVGIRSLRPLRVIVVVLAIAAVSASMLPTLTAVEQRADAGLNRFIRADIANYVLTSAMTGDAGAMPRDEFRGMTFDECDQLNSRDCFITVYDEIAIKEGVGAAVANVVDKVKENRGATFPAHCHQVVHNLGQLAFTLADEFQDAAELDPQVCGTGYTHGLWEQQFTELGDEVMFTRTGTLCNELNMRTPWYKWTCSHILGHLLVTRMMDNPTRALEYCVEITDPQAITDCQAGAWMNFFQDDVVIAEMVKRGSLKDLFSVCYGALDDVKFLCYQELFPVIYPMVGENDYLAAAACLEYAEKSGRTGDPWQWGVSYADRCVQGLSRGVAVSSFQDYRVIGPRCQSMPPEAQNPCITAAAASVVLNTGSTKAGFELCKLVSEEGYRNYCFFWTKHSRKLLANGPNNQNLPGRDEIRLPEGGMDSNRSAPFTVPN